MPVFEKVTLSSKGAAGRGASVGGAGELGEAGARDTEAPKRGGGKALGTWHPDAGLTCDLVVIADKAGDVTLGKLPLHSGRGEARVGAGQLGSYRQDQCEWEEAATNGEDRTLAGSPNPLPAPPNSRLSSGILTSGLEVYTAPLPSASEPRTRGSHQEGQHLAKALSPRGAGTQSQALASLTPIS